MAHDVFVSYSTKDKPVADKVCASLETSGIRCWIAPRDIQPGRSFAGEITRGIRASKIMVLVFSGNSNRSEQVLREVQLAVDSHLHIVQFRIEDIPASDDLKYFLGTSHWLDALSPPLEGHLSRLDTSVRTLLNLPPPVSENTTAIAARPISSGQPPSGRFHGRRFTIKRMALGTLVVCMVALVAIGIIYWVQYEFKKGRRDFFGTWNWTPTEVVTVRPNGTLHSRYNGDGTWQQTWLPRRFILRWQGFEDDLRLSADGQTLTGDNQYGRQPNRFTKRSNIQIDNFDGAP